MVKQKKAKIIVSGPLCENSSSASTNEDYIRCRQCNEPVSTCKFEMGGQVPHYVPQCEKCASELFDPMDAYLMDLKKFVYANECNFDFRMFSGKMLALIELIVERLQEDDD